MPTIPTSIPEFFQELERNNNLEWFEQNKSRFESEVHAPFLTLLEALMPGLRKLETRLPEDAASAIMRMGLAGRQGLIPLVRANVSPEPRPQAKGGRKRELPGYYLAIGSGELHVGGGLFSLDREGQAMVRKHIKSNSSEFMALAQDAGFVDKFGGIQGEPIRRLGRDLDSIRLVIPEIAFKEFYYVRGFRLQDHLEQEAVVELIEDHFRTISPLNGFFRKAIEGEEEEEKRATSGFFRLRDQGDESE